MADMDNPIVVTFVKEQERRIADVLVGLEGHLDTQENFYINNVLPILTAGGVTDADLVPDGLFTAGRVQLNVGDVKAIAAAIGTIKAAVVAAKTVLVKASVNPRNPLA
jgi:hypothetical protein